MITANFEYHRPTSLNEALTLLSSHADDVKLLAGGHSLIPVMKFRLAQPKHLVDLQQRPSCRFEWPAQVARPDSRQLAQHEQHRPQETRPAMTGHCEDFDAGGRCISPNVTKIRRHVGRLAG